MAGAAVGGSGLLLAGSPGAGAQPRTLQVTLLGGRTFTVTLDVPPGTPLDRIHLPGIALPVVSVVEVGAPAGTPTVAIPGLPAPHPAPPAPAPGPDVSVTGDAPTVAGQGRQRPSGHRTRRPAPGSVSAAHPASRTRRAATRADGRPTPADPTYSVALPGPALVGVPEFFIDKFRVPPFLLPIYQAAAVQYGVRWEVLAAINEIETDYGRNLSVSSAGAEGWMQFMPETWRTYGVDANDDGRRDPYNPVDAIFSAARYLKAAGFAKDVRRAVFAYNHADWYVDSVLLRARLIGGTPAELVGSLTGLAQGRFPISARTTYADGRHATDLFARTGAAVVAVQDAKVVRLGRAARRGRYVVLRDAYGNTYTYAKLGRVLRAARPAAAAGPSAAAVPGATRKQRLYAHPPAGLAPRATHTARGRLVPLRPGARVPGGAVIARIGTSGDGTAPHVRFTIRPAGRGAPLIDPKPILDGWKLLESTAVYRAKGRNPLLTGDDDAPSIGQVLLMTKHQLQRRVLSDPRVTVYAGGRRDIAAGRIDRRALMVLEVLASSGLKPTVSCLQSGHSYLTSSGNVSEHSSGNAVDISAINGVPILGHQGAGSITDVTIRRLLTLQGVLRPHQIISLMAYDGADNTLALPDHADHIHVGYRPDAVTVLEPLQWTKLVARLRRIDNPVVDPS